MAHGGEEDWKEAEMSEHGEIGWAILDKYGHTRLGGYITEEQRFGGTVGRIDIPMADGSTMTQFFGANSFFGLTPVSEEVARAVAARSQPEPVHRYELPRALMPAPEETQRDMYREDPDDNDPVKDDEGPF